MDAIRILVLIKEPADLAMVQWAVNAAQIHFQFIPYQKDETLFQILNRETVDCVITGRDEEWGLQQVFEVLQMLQTTLPTVVVCRNKSDMPLLDPLQGRVTVEIEKNQLTPQLLGQSIVQLTQIQREIARNEVLKQALHHEKYRFHLLAKHIRCAFVDMNKKGIVTDYRGELVQSLWISDEPVGKPAWEVMPKNFDIEDAVYHTLSGETFSQRTETESGLIDARYYPVLDDQHKVIGICGLFYILEGGDHADVAAVEQQVETLERQRADQQQRLEDLRDEISILQQYTDNYNQILNNTDSALFQVLVDEDNRLSISYMSRSIVNITGFDAEHLVKEEVRQQLFTADDVIRLKNLINTAAANWLPISTEVTIYPLQGEPRRIYVQARPQSHPEGIQWDGFLQVIDQNRGAHKADLAEYDIEEIKDERDAALEEVKMKSLFLMSMSKEMRHPLETMLTMVNLLLETELNGEQKEFASMLYSAGHALITMTNDVLDVSRIESNEFKFAEIAFDLRILLDDILSRFHRKANYKGVKLYSLLPYNLPQRIFADAGRLRQIINHLMSNALHYTDSGEVTLQVMMLEDHDDKVRLRFEINDTGANMGPEQRRHLFQMFKQRRDEEGMEYRSSGLRLIVARQLVEVMGGEFGFFNNQHQGTTFWFSLPVTRHIDTVHHPVGEVVLSGSKVLVVSDNPSSYRVLRESMYSWGMDVEVVEEGDQALERLLENKQYRCVILDAQVADMDDYELARIIRNDATLRHVRQILLTNVAERGDSERAHQSGIHGFLTKPVQESLLLDCLKTVLSLPASTEKGALVTRHSLEDQKASRLKSILVGCHEMEFQKQLQYELDRHGYRVELATSGPEVLSALQKQLYAAVLLAPDLPIWDAYTTARSIRSRLTDPPLLFGVVKELQSDIRQRCLDSGMVDCLDAQSLDQLSQKIANESKRTALADE